MSTVMGEGPFSLDDLVANPSLEEVWVNGPNKVFVAEAGVSKPVPMALSVMDIRAFVERTLRLTGRRVDVSSPFVDASLPDAPLFTSDFFPGVLGAETVVVSAGSARVVSRYGVPR